jgi:hypothetical protein
VNPGLTPLIAFLERKIPVETREHREDCAYTESAVWMAVSIGHERTCELGLGLGLHCQQLVETKYPRGMMEVHARCEERYDGGEHVLRWEV